MQIIYTFYILSNFPFIFNLRFVLGDFCNLESFMRGKCGDRNTNIYNRDQSSNLEIKLPFINHILVKDIGIDLQIRKK